MKLTHFIDLVKNPTLLNESDVASLKDITEKFPYFQSAHLLYSKILNDSNDLHFFESLKKTASICTDRKKLYYFLQEKPLIEPLNEKEDGPEAPIIKPAELVVVKPTESLEKTDEDTIILTSNTGSKSKGRQNYFLEKPERNPFESKEEVLENRQETFTNESIALLEEKQESVETNDYKKEFKISPIQEVSAFDEQIAKVAVHAFVEKELLKVTEIDEKDTIDSAESAKNTDNVSEKHSFNEWLKNIQSTEKVELKAIPAQVETAEKNTEKETTVETSLIEKQNLDLLRSKQEQFSSMEESLKEKSRQEKLKIIEKIINEEPKISKLKTEKGFYSASGNARSSVLEDENLITETLARIYAIQGNTSKAIRAYEILSLKFPEKSVYFASLIKELKKK